MRRSLTSEAPSKDEQIFAEAVRIFKEKGYHATSVQDIADAVGLQKGSLYHYISSKEELLLRIFERSTGALTLQLQEILAAPLSPTEKLQRAIEAHLGALTSQLDLYTVYLSERRTLTGRIHAQVHAEAERQARLLEQIVQEGIAAGDFRALNGKMATHAILGMCNWLYQWYSPSGHLTSKDIASIFSDLVLGGLEGRPGKKEMILRCQGGSMALLAVGTPAPTFKGMNLTGPEINLENYKGKKAVVLIFAPDRVDPTSTNQVRTLYNKYKDKAEVITASRKVPSVSMAKAFLGQLGVKFPTLYDPQMNVYKLYGVENPVAIYILDPEGSIVYAAQSDPAKVDIKSLEEAIAANVK